jgi:hypothetical protein
VTGVKPKQASKVGIVYLVGDRLWIETTPVAQAMNVGDFSFHERYHYQYWEQLVKQKAVPDTEYEQCPRGRVSYDKKSGKFTLLADRCILREQSLIEAILSRMCLQARDTETGTDRMYRCSGCLRRNR